MKSLSEYFYEQNKEEFTDIEDVKSYLTSIVNMMLYDDKHFGDCVKEINTCLMCEVQDLLNEYWEYTILNHPVLK